MKRLTWAQKIAVKKLAVQTTLNAIDEITYESIQDDLEEIQSRTDPDFTDEALDIAVTNRFDLEVRRVKTALRRYAKEAVR